jgi:hypothetical protein
MRLIVEIAVLLYLLSLIGQAEQDGFHDGLDACSIAQRKI